MGKEKFYTLKEWEKIKNEIGKSKFTPLIKRFNPSLKDWWAYDRLNPGFRRKRK